MPRWLLPTLALSALVGFALAWVAYLEPWARRGPFWDKYQQVRLGMSQSEVEGILGPPALEEGGGFMPLCAAWFEGRQAIAVNFDPEGRATEKRFRVGRSRWWVREGASGAP
jgi:hypothetical protein